MAENSFRAGFDIGNVILHSTTDGSDFLGPQKLPQEYVPDAISTIRDVVARISPASSFLISKCGLKMQTQTLEVLESTGFYERTGFLPENVRFCRRRMDKAVIADELDLSAFVDDRLDILISMVNVPIRMLFQRVDKPLLPPEPVQTANGEIQVARDWGDVKQAIIAKA